MPDIARRAIALFILLMTLAGVAGAATANDFYGGLLRRGIADYDAGRYEAAARELDVAAFGLIEALEQYETAKIYAALANDKVKRDADARAAAQHVLSAERVQRRFAQLAIPAEIRSTFLAVARKSLTAADFANLTSSAALPAAAVTSPRSQPAPQNPAPATTTTTQPAVQQPPPNIVPVPPAPKTQPKIEERTIDFPEKPKPQPEPVKPQPEKPKPQPEPAKPQPVPQTVAAKPQPPTEQPRVEAPKPEPPQQMPKVDVSKPIPSSGQGASRQSISGRLAEADKLLAQQKLVEARAIYREILETRLLDHDSLLAVAEGAYRSRDFAMAVEVFGRLGTLRPGEEPYRYYFAVSLYESGRYKEAKRELDAALPHIEITPSVSRYRAKIEGAID